MPHLIVLGVLGGLVLREIGLKKFKFKVPVSELFRGTGKDVGTLKQYRIEMLLQFTVNIHIQQKT